MAHVVHGNFGKQSRYSQDSHPGGGWKFGVFAVTATIASALFLTSSFVRGAATVAPPRSDAYFSAVPVVPETVAPRSNALIPTAVDPIEVPRAAQSSLQPPMASEASAPLSPSAIPAGSAASPDIRSINLATLPALLTIEHQVNGRIDSARVEYADLTSDGVDEAIVPISSDGTQGDLALVVLKLEGGVPRVILSQVAGAGHEGLVMSLDGRQLTLSSAVYGPSDANCCPSQLVRTYYRWDGNALVTDHTNAIAIPQGKQAD